MQVPFWNRVFSRNCALYARFYRIILLGL